MIASRPGSRKASVLPLPVFATPMTSSFGNNTVNNNDNDSKHSDDNTVNSNSNSNTNNVNTSLRHADDVLFSGTDCRTLFLDAICLVWFSCLLVC